MSKSSSAKKVALASIDQLFGNSKTSGDVDMTAECPVEVPIADLHEFHNHPFIVRDDDKMEETVASIQAHGVLVPGIVRIRPKGGYEIISGHRRKRACELAGLSTMPVYVRNLTDDESVIVMVDSNLQREEILISEKAKAYRLRYEAVKHQGVSGAQKGRSLDAMSVETGENAKKIQRYLALSRLNDDLLKLVDEKKLGMIQGVALSSLSVSDQELVYQVISDFSIRVSTSQAEEIKRVCHENGLDEETLRHILEQNFQPRKHSITIKLEGVRDYFPEDYTDEEISNVITKLLAEWWKANQSHV